MTNPTAAVKRATKAWMGSSTIGFWLPLAAVIVLAVVVGAVGILSRSASSPVTGARNAALANPVLDPGTSLSKAVPDFSLTDQFGRRVSLRSFRGRVVLLYFADSECTSVCPVSTTEMVTAKRMLGAAGRNVQLLGVDANPAATAIKNVRAYSLAHGMMRQWHFLTGSLSQLTRVWHAYGIEAKIVAGQVDHSPAMYLINQKGRLVKLFWTAMGYTGVAQQAQLLAQEISNLLPGHPSVRSNLSYAQIPPITPSTPVALPRPGGGTLRLGPSGSPRLLLFFATWDSQTSNLAAHLETLNHYQTAAPAAGLPPLTAVDEGIVEAAPIALPNFLRTLSHPLSYPVAIDQSGRVGDGYEVQDEPWLVLVSPAGRLLYYYNVSAAGWPTPAALAHIVRAALTRTPKAPASARAAQRTLAGSPAPLSALHQQAGQLLGTQTALTARLRALRGYPIVVNAWASWCGPCRAEFPLLASASARYGRQVAFLGADSDDSPGDARSFLAQHPVSYPSYQTTTTSLSSLAAIVGLPTTIFINRAGRVVYVHTGQYDAQGALDADINHYALGG